MSKRFWSAEGKSNRIIAARILPGSDLILGLIDVCQKYNVKAGGISSMIGSLETAEYQTIQPDPNSKTGASFTERMVAEGPVELLSGQGLICQREEGMFIHLHAVMVDKNQKVFGGHIERGFCTVLNTLELIIVEGENLLLSREYDDETGFIQTVPKNI
ncbi:DNA-binding protein [Peribacillus cavernae]|uniref:DNA-binding protein n=1 Tax=Peribacillus cavernae TaxID=1674310 RepID=A0A433HFJ5_9BACI|nr:PPC domain-containing DNA-binding protein [Peribacillus cavernae]MDQ0219418.1 putative DNA-binding protein with PD1-like motif [Peribacillus cavernae]RUQ27154.1 DNA-binding protein [Peribacillus cavernae]